MTSEHERGALRRRALRLRCPLCGEGELFHGLLAMNERCRRCGFRFEREPGYFLGSIYLNYGAAVAVAVALHLLLSSVFGWSAAHELLVIVPAILGVAFFLFRWSRALWLAFDLACDPPKPNEFT